MKMDGDDIQPGDAVFDIVYGPGFIHRIDTHAQAFFVRFGNRSAGYRPDGVSDRAQRRTLYWQDPVVFVPSKSQAKWQLLLRMVRALWRTIERDPLVEVIAQENVQGGGHGP